MLFDLEVFQNDEFKDFRMKMGTYLKTVVNPVNLQMEHLLPGLNSKIDSIHSELLSYKIKSS